MNILSSGKIISILLMLSISLPSFAAGLIKPANSGLPDLEIKDHKVHVVVENGYVTTSIEQVFYNPNQVDLEAIYSFPVPEHAAVGEFIYWINNQAVIGEVFEKQQAKAVYDQEKSAGRHAALVEQNEYKSFDISVAHVPKLSDVKVRLVYVQSAHTDLSIGRYVYPLEEGGVDEEKQAFWSRNDKVTGTFSFKLDFRSSYPLDALRLPNHPNATITQVSEQEWSVSLSNQTKNEAVSIAYNDSVQSLDAIESESSINTPVPGSKPSPNTNNIVSLSQDILVYWRHKAGLPGALDLVTYKQDENKKGTFMLTFTPGDDLGLIESGSDWIFVLDVSGSMEGKYATLLQGVRQGLQKLNSKDRFRIVLFNQDTHELTTGFKSAEPNNILDAIKKLEAFEVGGGTDLYKGLSSGLNQLDADRATGIILVSDGVANVGQTQKKTFLSLLKQHDVRLFTFIMGNSANRPLLQGMANISEGFAMSVSNADDILGQIMLATSKLSHQAFTNIQLEIDGVKHSNLSPKKIPSAYYGQQIHVYGHYWQGGEAKVKLSANVGGEQKVYTTTITFPAQSLDKPELERLWAYASIQDLQDKLDYLGPNKDTEQAIVDIALEYSLVTNYTSMLVLEDAIFESMGVERKNKARVEAEQLAREQRKAKGVQDNRADKKQAMFSSPRPSNSGGSTHPVMLIALTILLVLRLKKAGFFKS